MAGNIRKRRKTWQPVHALDADDATVVAPLSGVLGG